MQRRAASPTTWATFYTSSLPRNSSAWRAPPATPASWNLISNIEGLSLSESARGSAGRNACERLAGKGIALIRVSKLQRSDGTIRALFCNRSDHAKQVPNALRIIRLGHANRGAERMRRGKVARQSGARGQNHRHPSVARIAPHNDAQIVTGHFSAPRHYAGKRLRFAQQRHGCAMPEQRNGKARIRYRLYRVPLHLEFRAQCGSLLRLGVHHNHKRARPERSSFGWRRATFWFDLCRVSR